MLEKARRVMFRQAAPRRGERLVAILRHRAGGHSQLDVTSMTPEEFAHLAALWDAQGDSFHLKRQPDPDCPTFLGGALGLVLLVAVLVVTVQTWGVTP